MRFTLTIMCALGLALTTSCSPDNGRAHPQTSAAARAKAQTPHQHAQHDSANALEHYYGHRCTQDCHHEVAISHSCNLVKPMGLLRTFNESGLVALVEVSSAETSGKHINYRTKIQEVLKGESPGEIKMVAGLDAGAFDHFEVGERVLVALNPLESGGYEISAYRNGAIFVDRPECQGVVELGRSLLTEQGPQAKAQTIVSALPELGSIGRLRALLDLTPADAQTLDTNGRKVLGQMLAQGDVFDPSLQIIMDVLASTGKGDVAPALAAVLERPDAIKLFEVLAQVARFDHLAPSMVVALDPYRSSADAFERRFATHVLARIAGVDGAKERLRSMLNDVAVEVRGEALVGLVGDESARSISYDVVRTLLQETPYNADEVTPIQQRLNLRRLSDLRTKIPSAPDMLSLAAIYVLAHGDEKDRAWITSRKALIHDPALASFIDFHSNSLWADFDTPW